MDHAWEKFEGTDALGPSINFQWWKCARCGAQVRTAQDHLAVFYFENGKPPETKVTPPALEEAGVDEDCDQQVVNAVHVR